MEGLVRVLLGLGSVELDWSVELLGWFGIELS